MAGWWDSRGIVSGGRLSREETRGGNNRTFGVEALSAKYEDVVGGGKAVVHLLAILERHWAIIPKCLVG